MSTIGFSFIQNMASMMPATQKVAGGKNLEERIIQQVVVTDASIVRMKL